MTTDNKIAKELETIRSKNKGGLLLPAEVVKWARAHTNSELHKRPEWKGWDDGKMLTEAYREAARRIIQIVVISKPDEAIEPQRAYVSLPSQRTNGHGGGYTTLEAVLARPKMTEEYIEDCKRELRRLYEKYRRVGNTAELKGLFHEIEKLTLEAAKG